MKAVLVVALVVGLAAPLAAQQGDRSPRPPRCRPGAVLQNGQCVIDMEGVRLDGRLRTPQLLYFLERANEELERASLERRSFIPEVVRTLEEEAL